MGKYVGVWVLGQLAFGDRGLCLQARHFNTDMGVRRGKKKTGGGGHTGGSRRRGKEIDMEKAVEGTDDRTMGGDDQ